MSRFLDACMRFIDGQPFDIIRMSEFRGDGEIETVERMRVSPCQDLYSGAKTYTMTAVGLLCDRGLLDVEETVTDVLRDLLPAGMDERWTQCTVEMVLRHRPGLPGGFLDIDCSPYLSFPADYLSYLLTYPLAYTPGTEERYSDGAYYLLSRIVERRAGMPMDDFLRQTLLTPLGVQEIAFTRCPKGHPMGATGVYVHSADYVKLGALYLKKGVYCDKRLLSEAWVRAVEEKEYNFEWDSTHRIYFKGGMFGQKLIVAPEQDRAVAMQAFGADSAVVADWVRDYKE